MSAGDAGPGGSREGAPQGALPLIARPLGRDPDFGRELVTAVVQDGATGQVLMVAHMNRDAYRSTLASGRATFWSRSRKRLWEKGETSGNTLRVLEVRVDCDGDSVLLRVEPAGPACHTGARSCFEAPPAAAGPSLDPDRDT